MFFQKFYHNLFNLLNNNYKKSKFSEIFNQYAFSWIKIVQYFEKYGFELVYKSPL